VAERLQETPDPTVAPPGEAIHLPEPSYLPFAVAFGMMLALVGVITTWVISIIGLLILLPAVFRWIGKTRAEMAELPLEHRH
jgi:uncharacterized membrane protein YecN with MAPEG domain